MIVPYLYIEHMPSDIYFFDNLWVRIYNRMKNNKEYNKQILIYYWPETHGRET